MQGWVKLGIAVQIIGYIEGPENCEGIAPKKTLLVYDPLIHRRLQRGGACPPPKGLTKMTKWLNIAAFAIT